MCLLHCLNMPFTQEVLQASGVHTAQQVSVLALFHCCRSCMLPWHGPQHAAAMHAALPLQAQDRCHRIGQTREVHIYRLVSEKTIEENILSKSDQKRQLDHLAIQSGGFNTEFLQKFNPKDLLGMRGESAGSQCLWLLLYGCDWLTAWLDCALHVCLACLHSQQSSKLFPRAARSY